MQVEHQRTQSSRRNNITEALIQDEIYYGSQASEDAHAEVTSAAAVAQVPDPRRCGPPPRPVCADQ